MKRVRSFAASAGLVLATTLGAGIFALPYVFSRSGILLGIVYLLFFSLLITAIHLGYFDLLSRLKKRERLVGLAREYGGSAGYAIGALSVFGGLLLELTAYLILGAQFLTLLFPTLHYLQSLLLVWFIFSFPLLLRLPRLIGFEFVEAIFMCAAIAVVYVTSGRAVNVASTIHWRTAFLPFAPILFALTGWTAIEPVHDGEREGRGARGGVALGTFLSGFLYLIFAVSVIASAPHLTPDTLSGLAGWPAPKIMLLLALGLFAIWTSYAPVSLEIKNSLADDFRVPPLRAEIFVFVVPLLLVLVGLNNFLAVVGVAGGVFLALQHCVLAFVVLRGLSLSLFRTIVIGAAGLIFFLGALYQVFFFVVH